MATSYDIPGATHGYGPVGCVLGMFAGHLDRATAHKLWTALMDSGSQDWRYMMDARTDTGREYHRRRWLDLLAGADYIDLIFPSEGRDG